MKMKSRLLALLLTLVVVIGLLPTMDFTAHAAGGNPCSGDHTGWTELSSLPDLGGGCYQITSGGKYYLSADAKNDTNGRSTIIITCTEAVTLCLNGKTIYPAQSPSSKVIALDKNSTLHLCDCVGTGCITGEDEILFAYDNATINMYAGTLKDGASTAVYLMSGAAFNMYGGTITGCNTWNTGTAAIESYQPTSEINIYGGSITGNHKRGVYTEGSIYISGNAKITGNGWGDVCLYEGQTITVGTLTSGADIGVTAAGTGNDFAVTGSNAADYSQYFHADSSSYAITNKENTVYLHKHSCTYSAAGDTITEKCSVCNDHTATATLTADDTAYTGSPITTAASVAYGDGWAGSKDHGQIQYSDNLHVGTATAEITIEGHKLTTTFAITAADIGNATVTVSPDHFPYTGTPASPVVTVEFNGATLVPGTDYNVSWDKTGFTNVDSYTATITGTGNFTGTVTKACGITQKEVGISWGGTLYIPYTGQLVVPEVSATGLAAGDSCDVIVSVVETVEGAGVKPGKWTAKITGLSNGNYKLPDSGVLEVPYTIYVYQTQPVVSGVAETIRGKNDGRISGLTTDMEYATELTNLSSAYTRITDPNMTFAPGTYYVRYASKEYHLISPCTEVTIAQGRKLTVTVPAAQTGYTLTTAASQLEWNGSTTLTFALKDGYSKTNAFAVKINGNPITLNDANQYVITGAQENMDITVEGAADTTAPNAEIKAKSNSWTEFLNDITFGLFSKETLDVTITADDAGSGVKSIEYYLADAKMSLDAVKAVTAWEGYNGTFQIKPDKQYVIYAKITDNDGNAAYISSNGLVLDATAPVISGVQDGKAYYTTQKVSVTDTNLDSVTVNGTPVLDPSAFTLPGDTDAEYVVSATDKAGNSTTVTVTMKPISDISAPIDSITTENVSIDDAQAVDSVKAIVAAVDTTYATDAEKAALQEIADKVAALDKVLAKLKKPASPGTGDSNSLWLWSALLFICGAGGFGMILNKRKSKR